MGLFEAVLLWLHVLLFVYWLGGDLGVFYSSRFRNSSDYSAKTRALIGRITANIDMAPRTTMVLMVPIGFSLVALNDYWLNISDFLLIFIWLFSALWLGLVWWLHLTKDAERKKPWSKFDLVIRWLLFILLSATAVISFIFGQPYTEHWLALKVLLFACTIFCGIMIRVSAKPYVLAFQKMINEGSSSNLELEINSSAAAARRWVKMIWILISLAAFIGIWKPMF